MQRGETPDERDLLDYLAEGRFLVEAHAFVPIDPRHPHGRDKAIEALWQQGYLVHSKIGAIAGEQYRCNFDVEITLELMRTAEVVRPDIIVLMSGDKDFLPVILELRRRGIRVEVAAFPELNAARDVILKASGFIDLDAYLHERRTRRTVTDARTGPYVIDVNEEMPAAAGDESRPDQAHLTPASCWSSEKSQTTSSACGVV